MGNLGKISKITGLAQSVGAINNLIDVVTRLTPIETPTVKPTFTSTGISYNTKQQKVRQVKSTPDEDFSIQKISGLFVTITGGSIIVGSNETLCGDTTVTIDEDNSIIGWEYCYESKEFIIKNFGTSFEVDSNYIRKRLYKFSKTGSTVSLAHIFKPEIYPANFG